MSKHKYSLKELRELKEKFYVDEEFKHQRGIAWYSAQNFLSWLEEREKED